MRNLEKGQHIFIAFQDGKAVLDSQLRPRIYTSLENADRWTPTVNKGKIEYVEYAPTFTPPNEWVSVEDEIPSDDDDGLEFFCMTNATGKCGGVLPLEWEVATVRGKTVRRWKWRSRISPWAVTHWMKRPAPPGENNNVPTKAPNEPLTLEELREMDGEPVWVERENAWSIVEIQEGKPFIFGTNVVEEKQAIQKVERLERFQKIPF